MKRTSEQTFIGIYKDMGDDKWEPTIQSHNLSQTANLSNRIANELQIFEGKKVKLTIKIEV